MRDNRMPPEDILSGVRHITAWDHWLSAKVGKELGDERRRSYLGDKLRSIMNELEIDVSHKESRGMWGGKYKLTYLVSHRGTTELEFTDLLQEGTNMRTLGSIHRYHAGDWEQKLLTAYKECTELSNQWNSVSRLIDQLASASHTPEEVIGLIEATGDPEQTVRLLALSSSCETMCVALFNAYTYQGRSKEAKFVMETCISIYPEEAAWYLMLGYLFYYPLYNLNKPPADSLPFLRKLVESTGQAGEKMLKTMKGDPALEWADIKKKLTQQMLKMMKREDPALHRVLVDKDKFDEFIARGNFYDELIEKVTLETLGCTYELARKSAEEQFMEARRLSKDKKVTELANNGLRTLKMMDERMMERLKDDDQS